MTSQEEPFAVHHGKVPSFVLRHSRAQNRPSSKFWTLLGPARSKRFCVFSIMVVFWGGGLGLSFSPVRRCSPSRADGSDRPVKEQNLRGKLCGHSERMWEGPP